MWLQEFERFRLSTRSFTTSRINATKIGKYYKKGFNEIQSIVTEAKNNKSKTTIDRQNITINNMERLTSTRRPRDVP